MVFTAGVEGTGTQSSLMKLCRPPRFGKSWKENGLEKIEKFKIAPNPNQKSIWDTFPWKILKNIWSLELFLFSKKIHFIRQIKKLAFVASSIKIQRRENLRRKIKLSLSIFKSINTFSGLWKLRLLLVCWRISYTFQLGFFVLVIFWGWWRLLGETRRWSAKFSEQRWKQLEEITHCVANIWKWWRGCSNFTDKDYSYILSRRHNSICA